MSTKLVKASEASTYYGISISNLRKWAREGSIPTQKTPRGHYQYIIHDHSNSDNSTDSNYEWSPYIIYARVSSRKQEGDLERQVRYMSDLYPHFTIIRDIGSGTNYQRKGFQDVLERLFKGDIKKVVVAHPDRFVRFGFDFFEWLFSQFGAVLESVENHNSDPEADLVGDIMEIFTVFTSRYYGRRKYQTTSGQKEDTIQERKGTRGRPKKQNDLPKD